MNRAKYLEMFDPMRFRFDVKLITNSKLAQGEVVTATHLYAYLQVTNNY